MAERWNKFRNQMKAKRTGKKGPDDNESRSEIVVQRLSANVSGKAQKYTRVGPREFVEFSDKELNIDNVKDACLKHFALGENMICDVLAGEQGPSCSSIKQVPNLKLIHVRFIEDESDGIVEVKYDKRKHVPSVVPSVASSSTSPPCKSLPSPVKEGGNAKKPRTVPRSLSVSSILKLGRVIEATNVSLINLYSFNLETMVWSTISRPVEFVISPELLGEGRFRKAYKATSTTTEFTNCEWVVKRYNNGALEEIKDINLTVENHTKKVVQMHYLAKNFASRLESEVAKQGVEKEFGQVMHYKNIFLGKYADGEVVSVEEFVDGRMLKYVNNDGIPCESNPNILRKKAECLVHFSYQDSNNEVMLVDVQGVGYNLFDPEIASTTILHQKTDTETEVMFTAGNLSTQAIDNFKKTHSCNSFCQCLALKELN